MKALALAYVRSFVHYAHGATSSISIYPILCKKRSLKERFFSLNSGMCKNAVIIMVLMSHVRFFVHIGIKTISSTAFYSILCKKLSFLRVFSVLNWGCANTYHFFL